MFCVGGHQFYEKLSSEIFLLIKNQFQVHHFVAIKILTIRDISRTFSDNKYYFLALFEFYYYKVNPFSNKRWPQWHIVFHCGCVGDRSSLSIDIFSGWRLLLQIERKSKRRGCGGLGVGEGSMEMCRIALIGKLIAFSVALFTINTFL